MASAKPGQIITFYSYKGGTGRTMALANVACVLARQQFDSGGRGVLMIDWDLEAPGLHRFFRDEPAWRKGAEGAPPGLIDLAYELVQRVAALKQVDGKQRSGEDIARAAIARVDWKTYVRHTRVPGLDLVQAGRMDPRNPNTYAERVNKFDWEGLYGKAPHLLRVLAEAWAEQYDYVLIDSRTGITDTSGICTAILPEKLVVVFTPNSQSLQGGVEMLKRATEYRKESSDLRPLLVFPLVSRVEATEPELRHAWRFGSPERDTPGYQPEFERALAEVYGKPELDLGEYFEEMQIQHIPRFAYGEEIAVLVERTRDKFSLRRSYETFAQRVAEAQAPWNSSSPTASGSPGQARAARAHGRALPRALRLIATWRGLALASSAGLGLSLALTVRADLQRHEQSRALSEELRRTQAQMAIQLQDAKAQHEQDERSLQDFRRRQEEAEKQASDAQVQLSNQLAELKLANAEKRLTEEQLSRLNAAVDDTRRRLQESIEQAKQAEASVASKSQWLEMNAKQIEEAEQRNKALSLDLSKAGDQINQLQGVIASLQAELSNRTADSKSCQQDLDRARTLPIGTCAAPDTPICTPSGERSIASLRAGDLVLSVHHGRLVEVPVRRVSRVRVGPEHRVVAIQLREGEVLRVSGGHPTADGRRVDQLFIGEQLGSAQITGLESVRYGQEYTYDIQPDSDSGAYFAGGLLLGSTLNPNGAIQRSSTDWQLPRACSQAAGAAVIAPFPAD